MTDNNGKELKIEMWVDEDRMDLLRKAKMETLAKDKFAGMKVVDISCTSDLKDKLLQLYPCAKCDTSTTCTVELLPKEVKDRLFGLVVDMRSTGSEVLEKFLEEIETPQKI